MAARTWLSVVVVSAVVLVAALAAPAPTTAAAAGGSTDVEVRRLAGGDRASTAAAIALDGWTSADTAVVVDGWDDAAALAGAHLAARLDVPVLVSGTELPEVTAEALDVLGVDDVVVVGGAALPPSTVGGGVTRLDDPDPVALAARVAVEGPDAPVVLVSAATFADALSAANLAPARLLMTAPDELSADASRALDDLGATEVVLVGGEAAISPAVVDELESMGIGGPRVSGSDRYATSLATARTGAATVAIASGQVAADAIALVPWAARRGAAVILTTRAELPGGVEGWLRTSGAAEAVVAGGTAAVGGFVDRQVGSALAGGPPAGYASHIRALTAEEVAAMEGVSWRPGCPVDREALRVLELAHWTFAADVVWDGQLVLHVDHVADVDRVMSRLFDARFPIERIEPIEAYGGDDDASMAANNSSAFNCRFVGGTTRWSEHAHGRAVDINPIQNPFVRGDVVEPPAGRAFLDRSDVRPGMIVRPGPVVEAFAEIGWGWGADFSTSDDHQHFSSTGR
jgi:hypothetical protein